MHGEDFVAEVLNAIYSWNFVNRNHSTPNSPCIDLIDITARIGIQVTLSTSAAKLNETIACVRKHGLSCEINQLKVFCLVKKQTTYRVTATCPGVSFNWSQDVLDFYTILKEVNTITDDQRLKAIHSVGTKALPTLFATRRATLQTSRDRLERDLRVFDREVMSAPYCFEDPVEMYRAIREMRLALQLNGSSRNPQSRSCSQFPNAHSILRDTERSIRAKYPFIHEATIKHGLNVTYPDGAFSDAINLIMQIRGQLQPLLQEIESELEKIDAQL